MGVLRRKLRRDLWQRRGQLAAVILTIFLGITLFGASYDAFQNLETSYRSLYDELRFADFTIHSREPEALVELGSRLDGVGTASVRTVAEVPLRLRGTHELLGRVVGLPDSGRAPINRVMLLEGSRPDPFEQDTVLAEQHLAAHFGLRPGDSVEVLTRTGWTEVTIAGIVASPEYLWPARSRQDLLTSPDDFGVLFAPQSALRRLPENSLVGQALFLYAEGQEAQPLDQQLRELAARHQAGAAFSLEEQPSNAALQEDVQGFSDLAFMFPLLFLGAAGMATYVLLTRLVYSQQYAIGLLRANGFDRREVFAHYQLYGLVVGLTGAVPGILAGIGLGRLITGYYTDAISVPLTITEFHPATLFLGPAFGFLAGTLSALAPSLRATGLPPGVAMRGITGGAQGKKSLIERAIPPLRRLPARWKMVLRGIGRNPRRSASTMLGVILALILIMVSWGMLDTVEILMDRQFEQIQRHDARVYLTSGETPEPAPNTSPNASPENPPATALEGGDLLTTIDQVPGVAEAEPVAEFDVVVTSFEKPSNRYATQLTAFRRDTTMHRFLLDTGSQEKLPSSGVFAGAALRELLQLQSGDTIRLLIPSTGESFSTQVAGFVQEPFGTPLYAGLEFLQEATGRPASALISTVLVRYEDGVSRETMRNRLTELGGVGAFSDSKSLVQTIRSYMGLFYVFVGVMLLFGAIMAFALIFTTMSANISERITEIATLKAAGVGKRTITGLITAENLLLALIATGPGLILGYLAADVFMGTYSSDLFQLELHVRTRTFVLSGAAILIVALVSQWPLLKVIERLDVARVVRERGV